MGDDVYNGLAKHLAALGMGYPEKEDLTEILRESFTPQEAEVALAISTKVIPFEPVPLSEITPRVKIPEKELESILSNLAHRGLLFSKKMNTGWSTWSGVSAVGCVRAPALLTPSGWSESQMPFLQSILRNCTNRF